MNLLKLFYLLILCEITVSIPIELNSFSDIKLTKGVSEYYYHCLKYDTSNLHFIFIKLSDYEKTELNIYLDEIEEKFYLSKEEKLIIIPIIKKGLTKLTLKVNTNEKDLKMIFYDVFKIQKISLIDFLNLDFSENKSKFPYLFFNITVNKKIYFSLTLWFRQVQGPPNLNIEM